jgi:hypothetical protein
MQVMGSLFSREKYRIDLSFPLRKQFYEFIDEEYLSRYLQAEEKIYKYCWIIADGEIPALLKKPHQQKFYMLSLEEFLEYYQEYCMRNHEYDITNNENGKRVLIIYYTSKKDSYIFSKPVSCAPIQIVMKD